jgi:hypothetical protein
MSWRWIALALTLGTSTALAQQPAAVPDQPNWPLSDPGEAWNSSTVTPIEENASGSGNGFLTGNHDFRNFINFISNPLTSIDPRAVTAIYPLFGQEWISNASPIPNGEAQVYGPAITIALSDRFAAGINQGGIADANFSANPIQRQRIIQDERLQELLSARVAARVGSLDFSGDRFGFLNLGGFFQYTVIENVQSQFLLTVGLRWEAPCGSHELFQGYGPAELSPYFTVGKEFGNYHVLFTTGYEFPVGAGNDTLNVYYANIHFDRRCFGWLYPLVEINSNFLTSGRSVDFGLDTRRGFIDFGDFEATGNVVTLAAGANAVIVPEHLEFGLVYTTTIATQRDLEANGIIAKMTIRY